MTSQDHTIALVIPTYNRGDLIAETLDSALAQTRPFDQIVVVDDGSTDNTATVVAGYGDRVRYIHIANQGVQGARNSGVAAVSTALVALSDSPLGGLRVEVSFPPVPASDGSLGRAP